MYNKKVCILGASGVGKSSLIQRFLNGKFSEAHVASVGARIDKIVRIIDHDKVQLMLWDIESDNEAPGGFENYIKNASAMIYVVDGTRMETLTSAIDLRKAAEKHIGNFVPSIILFNKSDLVNDWEITHELADLPDPFRASSELPKWVERAPSNRGEPYLDEVRQEDLQIVRISLEQLSILADIPQAKLPQAVINTFTDLSPHLAESGPSHPHLGQRPLQELNAITILHMN